MYDVVDPQDNESRTPSGCGPLLRVDSAEAKPLRQQIFEHVRGAGRAARSDVTRALQISPNGSMVAYVGTREGKDVVVVGGTTGAVSAAVAASSCGARVFLAAPLPYLGDDMTATLRLWLEEGEVPASPLARRIFTDTQTGEEQPSAKLHDREAYLSKFELD